jgi:surfactin synthase thioesterase subunit
LPRDERRAWVERLLGVCELQLVELTARDDPFQRPLVDDLAALRDRLRNELDA